MESTTTLYAAAVNADGCESATRTAVTSTINEIPDAPTDASENSLCGAGEVDFEVSVADGCSVKWYDAATGGNVVSTANPYAADVESTTTLYAAAVSADGCESATRTAVTSTINEIPDAPTDPSSNSRYGAGEVDFEVSVADGCSVKWYDAASGGNVVSTANPYAANLAATATFYAAAVSADGCESESRTAVTSTVIASVASYGLSNKAAWDPIISIIAGTKAFTVWGKVIAPVDANSFYVDDGSGKPVKIVLAGHGFQVGEYVSATGMIDSTGGAPVLNALVAKKQN